MLLLMLLRAAALRGIMCLFSAACTDRTHLDAGRLVYVVNTRCGGGDCDALRSDGPYTAVACSSASCSPTCQSEMLLGWLLPALNP